MTQFVKEEFPVTNPPLVHYVHVEDGKRVGYYSPEEFETMKQGLRNVLKMDGLPDDVRRDAKEIYEAMNKAA